MFRLFSGKLYGRQFLDMNQDLHICTSKNEPFDQVRQNHLNQLDKEIQLDNKNVKIIANHHFYQNGIIIENMTKKNTEILSKTKRLRPRHLFYDSVLLVTYIKELSILFYKITDITGELSLDVTNNLGCLGLGLQFHSIFHTSSSFVQAFATTVEFIYAREIFNS